MISFLLYDNERLFLHRVLKNPPSSANFSPSSNIFIDLCWQFKPARDLFLKNPMWIVPRRRRPQTRHIFPSVTRYRILVLIRIIQVHELMQHSHISGRFVCFLHDYLSRLLHECVGGCGGPEGAEEKYCKHRFFSLWVLRMGYWASPRGRGSGTYRRHYRR